MGNLPTPRETLQAYRKFHDFKCLALSENSRVSSIRQLDKGWKEQPLSAQSSYVAVTFDSIGRVLILFIVYPAERANIRDMEP